MKSWIQLLYSVMTSQYPLWLCQEPNSGETHDVEQELLIDFLFFLNLFFIVGLFSTQI